MMACPGSYFATAATATATRGFRSGRQACGSAQRRMCRGSEVPSPGPGFCESPKMGLRSGGTRPSLSCQERMFTRC
jgi:hypothetical protein